MGSSCLGYSQLHLGWDRNPQPHDQAGKRPTENIKESTCAYTGQCNIKSMMTTLNVRVYDFLNRISIEELTRAPHTTGVGSATSPAIALQGEEP